MIAASNSDPDEESESEVDKLHEELVEMKWGGGVAQKGLPLKWDFGFLDVVRNDYRSQSAEDRDKLNNLFSMPERPSDMLDTPQSFVLQSW